MRRSIKKRAARRVADETRLSFIIAVYNSPNQLVGSRPAVTMACGRLIVSIGLCAFDTGPLEIT
jgi:hypothetical protein